MSKVYVVQNTDRNITPARRYGELQVMLSWHDVDRGTDHLVHKLSEELNGIKQEDFLLCIGDPIAIGIAVHIALIFTDGKINILRWDRKKFDYKKEEIRIKYD